MIDFDNIKFRAHSIGKLMGIKGLGITGEKELRRIWIKIKYGRDIELKNKYVAKGLAVEDNSITLLSRHHKIFYRKNEEKFENDFFVGTPDILHGDYVLDIKSSFDIHTYFNAVDDELNKMYKWQLLAYMNLTGKRKAKLSYCLTDSPIYLIDLEKSRLKYEMPTDTEEHFEACRQIDAAMTFGDIPMNERVHEIEVPYNESEIDLMKERVLLARDWMKKNLK